MLPAVSRGPGKNIGLPDPCGTPAGPAVVVVPYPNIGPHDKAMAFSPNVFVSGNNALHTGTIILMTQGDEAGTAHPMIKQVGRFTTGNPVVHVNHLPGINVGCPTTGNNMNNGLGAALVSPVKNVFYTHASGAPPRGAGDAGRAGEAPLAKADLEALADELAAAGRRSGAPLSWSLLREGIGLVRIQVFSADVPARLSLAMEAFEVVGATAAVIDLRGNPGGELSAFVDAASCFLPAGTPVAALVDVEGDRTEYRSSQEQPFSLPLVILVDGGTASAAELFAACLEAHGRAIVVGGPMYGKRTAQRVQAGARGEATRAFAGTVEVAGGPTP